MLGRTRWRLTVTLTSLAGLLFSTLVVAGPAAADGTWCDPDTNECFIVLSTPPSDPAPNPDENGWTPGAPYCYKDTHKKNADGSPLYIDIDCGSATSYWSNSRQCYVSLSPWTPPTRPAGINEDAGFYTCIFVPANGTPLQFWSNTVPPGLQVLTPGVAAQRLISTFQLRGVDIGMAPQVNPAWGHRRSYVGIPVWLWVENPQPLTWGPYTETATLGGQTITATAQVTGIRWNMGDGREVVCGSTGTAYSVGYGLSDSPTCGHRYDRTSQNQPGDRYTVTATSQWSVTWTSLAGATGTVNLTTSSSTQLEINEIQSVNVKPTTPNG